MFDHHQKSTGVSYTPTVAFLFAAIFSPAILIGSRPFGYETMSLALACSAICVALAVMQWKRSSQLSIPSFATRKAVGK